MLRSKPTIPFVLFLVTCCGGALAQSADVPGFHRRIPHPAIGDSSEDPADATFGWSMTMGDVNGGTSLDELVITSFFLPKDPFGSTPILEVGAAYPFHTRFLVPHDHAKLLPGTAMRRQHLGRLYPALGNVNEDSGGKRLLFLGAIGSDVTYGSNSVQDAGTLEIYDLNIASTSSPNVASLAAPTASSEATTPGYPANVRSFGHSAACGDIDHDGYDDLVVGAHDSDSGNGRVYVFFSNPSFPSSFTWVGLQSPAGAKESFGASVLVRDVDNDGYAEVFVGATERYLYPAAGKTGRVYVYSSSTILGLTTGDLQSPTPDQVLVPPSTHNDDFQWFGWTLFDVGDVMGPAYGTSNARPDVAVHAEATDWPGASGGGHGVTNAGALFVFRAWEPGETPTSGAPLLNPTPVVLQTPLIYSGSRVVHAPQKDARFGRGAAAVEWRNGSTDIRGLLVGEPDASVQDPNDTAFPYATPIARAGRVFFFPAPLDGTGGTSNAWGSFVLLEPKDTLSEGSGSPPVSALTNASLQPQAGAEFGAWIVAGKYNASILKDQFAVAARERSLSGFSKAGQVYTFTWPNP